ncbi:MAG: AAA family ATPase [Desulfuromonadales bacterium]|nr:AAA family ATPase [Desulfuromonadales bacterium]
MECPLPDDIGGCFKFLIMAAREKFGQKVVVLVDEYDKLIVDNLDQVEVAMQGQEVLRDPLSQRCEEHHFKL